MASKTGKVVGNFDERAIPAFGGLSANKERRDRYRKEAAKRARLHAIRAIVEKRKAKQQ